MAEICEACFDPEGYRQVLGVIARRLQEKEERWRMAYKALLLLEYLIKHGPEKVWRDVQQSGSVLQRLTRFEYVDENQRDHGVNVRHRAQEIQELVNNEARVREERRKAAENKAKYSGYSASQMRTAASGSSGASVGGASRMTGFGSDGGLATPQRSLSPPHPTNVSPPTRSTMHTHVGGDLAVDAHDMPHLDPVSATQARIATMKISNKELHYDDPVEEKPAKKKLSDVKANPKIAASLGLKIAPSPKKTQPVSRDGRVSSGATTRGTTSTPVGAPDKDLLGSMEASKAEESNDAWDPFGEMEQVGAKEAGTKERATTSVAFDPFSTLDESLAPAPASKPSGVQTISPDPFAPLQSPDPFAALQGASMPSTTTAQLAEKKEEKADPFADLLL